VRTFVHESELFLAVPRDELFPFFGEARNLERLTPAWVRFRIVTPGEIVMRVGTIIDYRLRIHGVPVRWRSRIAAWEPPRRFVDEQLHGPYRRWVHEHTFEEVDGGTACRDRVEYAVPGGTLIDRLIVRREVGRIFEHRRARLVALWGDFGQRGGG
jgi:ligand-binding SRPBCC domain-containing protein